MHEESNMKCIVCGSATHVGLLPWHFTCQSCQYERATLEPILNDKQAHSLVNESEREIGLKAVRLENFKTIVRYASHFASPGAKTLLDVGSAHGWFLEEASSRFSVLGVEPDTAVAARASEKGLPVRHGYFPDALKSGEKFDVIVFNDVIEHIPDIQSAITACKDRLNADGVLILNVPNSKGFFYTLSKIFAKLGWQGPFERMWQKDLPSPHVHYFQVENLTLLVQNQEFELVKNAELPSVRATGLMERLRYVGKPNKLHLYLQYFGILCVIPALRIFPSDIVVCIFRKK
jgi:SAM-dependent methyltransferase